MTRAREKSMPDESTLDRQDHIVPGQELASSTAATPTSAEKARRRRR